MALQTIEITESVSKRMDEKLAAVMEENKCLKKEIETMKQKLKYLEEEKKKANLIFFGVKEEKTEGSLIDYVIKTIEKDTEISVQPFEINKAVRLGQNSGKTRPLLVSFTTTWKRNLIFRCKNKFSSGIYIKEDFSKETLEKRKELVPVMLEERKKGNIAYIKKDKLIVKDPKEDNMVKRKRDQIESPHSSPTQETTSAPKKINKFNMNKFVTRKKSASISEPKN